MAIVAIEEKLWASYGEDAVHSNEFGEEEDAQVTALAELGTVLADFKAWTGGFSPREAEDRIEEYIESYWQDWSDASKEWLRRAPV